MSFTPTIGIEVHAELNTVSKMFCGCKNNPHESSPNSHVCPICLAHPGALPVPNESAIEKVLMFGQAVGATAANYSEFDRKNYFYPDIPKAYQISQYQFPFLTGGKLLDVDLTRVHLEEDTARSQHDQGSGSLVDFNRAGVPLMELVTEPVIHDAKTAGSFAKELQLLLRSLGLSEANMEKGEMRVEANISISETEELGTKVEVKNLNSFKTVEAAIEYEIARQKEVLSAGGVVVQETRGWDEVKSTTFSQRAKETAQDYRYFPDPDIPKINVPEYGAFDESRLADKKPRTPDNKRDFYTNLGITSEKIEVLIADINLENIAYSSLVENENAKLAEISVNFLLSDVVPLASKVGLDKLNASYFTELMQMFVAKEINSRVAKDILPELFGGEKSPSELVSERGLGKISNTEELSGIVNLVISENEAVFAEFVGGKEASLKFLIGQGMKHSKGAADPALLADLFTQRIKN